LRNASARSCLATSFDGPFDVFVLGPRGKRNKEGRGEAGRKLPATDGACVVESWIVEVLGGVKSTMLEKPRGKPAPPGLGKNGEAENEG